MTGNPPAENFNETYLSLYRGNLLNIGNILKEEKKRLLTVEEIIQQIYLSNEAQKINNDDSKLTELIQESPLLTGDSVIYSPNGDITITRNYSNLPLNSTEIDTRLDGKTLKIMELENIRNKTITKEKLATGLVQLNSQKETYIKILKYLIHKTENFRYFVKLANKEGRIQLDNESTYDSAMKIWLHNINPVNHHVIKPITLFPFREGGDISAAASSNIYRQHIALTVPNSCAFIDYPLSIRVKNK